MATRFRILILGDFHFGESYSRAGARILETRGYEHSTQHLIPFIEATDKFILNLETPILDPKILDSPLYGRKKYIHWADPVGTVSALQDLGVDGVSLANNHTLDYGPEGLQTTFAALRQGAIPWFGAGMMIEEAREPLRIKIPQTVGGGELLLHGSFQYSTSHASMDFYASNTQPGTAPLSHTELTDVSLYENAPDSFHIAFPHWGANYKWRTPGQYQIAHRLLRDGYNLILGHGSHVLQEIHRKQQRWVVYGIGNGNFQSGGRWARFQAEHQILPMSFWSIVELELDEYGGRNVRLKLYPVYSNNQETNFQPHPVSKDDFSHILNNLGSMSPNAWRFNNESRSVGRDSLGNYIELDLGNWEVGSKPANLVPLNGNGDPGDLVFRSVSRQIEGDVLRHYRGYSLGPALLAMIAERRGGQIDWLSGNRAIIRLGEKRFLVDGYVAHESALGEAFCKDKELTASALMQAGVSTPVSRRVSSPDDAITFWRAVGRPIVVKPSDGNKSRGVSVGLTDPADIRAAFERARAFGSHVLAQEYINGAEELRILASSHSAVAVNRRVLPHVFGDGRSSIRQLINDKNLQRQLNPALRNRPIPQDALTLAQLASTGLDLDSVVPKDQFITVRNVGGLGVGGDTHQMLHETASDVKRSAVEAISAIPGLDWGGVDLIIEEVTGTPYVIEINTRAAYGAALFPTYGEPEDVATAVWDLRWKDTPNEVTAEPLDLAPNQRSQKLGISRKEVFSNSDTVRFGDFIASSIERTGHTVKFLGGRVLEARIDGEQSRLLTTEGFSIQDRSVVTQNVRRHEIVRRLLRLSSVARVRGRVAESAQQVDSFRKEKGSSIKIVPVGRDWDSPTTKIIRRSDYLPDSMPKVGKKAKVFVQSYPDGHRLRVLADRFRAFAIISGDGALSRRALTSACKLAVHAVRAIPELRWGMVDIVVLRRESLLDRSRKVLVEGITMTPRLNSEDSVIAGSIDDFIQSIILG